MLLSILLILGGLVLLTVGGDTLTNGASRIASKARLTPTVIGLTVVAAGTSMPEFVVSVGSAVRGSTELALGNVVGSNLFNATAILGAAALIHPLSVQGSTVKMEWPVMLLASLWLHLLARDGNIDRLEGAVLLVSLVVFIAYSLYLARTSGPVEQAQFAEAVSHPRSDTWLRAIMLTAGGIILLVLGAEALVRGAVALAEGLGVPQVVIGLTVVAAGTSLPELATSCVAAYKGQDDVAVANVIGSNIFNIFGIMGGTALIRPLPVPRDILERDNLWMLGSALLLFPLLKSGMRVTRLEGALLMGVFVAYLVALLSSI